MILKILGHRYRIKYTNDEDKLMGDNRGLTDLENCIIYINSDLCKSEQEATLIHEILHCLNFEIMDEVFIDGLARALYQVFSDNNLYFGRS
jgi:hypothetical protein